MKTNGRMGLGPTASTSAAMGGAGPAPLKRLPRQRRPGNVAGAAVLVIVAAAVSVFLYRSSDERVPVVMIARDVAVGHKFTQADLDSAEVAVGPGVTVIPGRQLKQVVGQRAAVALRKGMLLSASQLTAQPYPPDGQTLVAARLKPGAMPPGLAPGWRVRVVFTSGDQGEGATAGASQARASALRDVAAVVDEAEGPDSEGATTVSLMVPDADSSTVARQAAAGMVALVVTERLG
ncbi:SAF domain-containing protein [Actinomadura violacea]|uniref:SAF domain-containing protein n=1 Tax=Actinomadura violacea TaxID=2819934 RepID=A0ABS3SAF1_9ACTN|nr:SAF domain-containing protein [Actinomadura violacea]MBO2465991.1 hypothetical protein [Actinomadura violacea]